MELKKEFTNKYSTSPNNVSRVLIQFDYTEVSKSVSDGTITDAKYYLRLYEVEGQTELNKSYSLSSFPLSQSWDEGTGKHLDNPKTTMNFFKKMVDYVNQEEFDKNIIPDGQNFFSISEIHFYHNIIFVYKSKTPE